MELVWAMPVYKGDERIFPVQEPWKRWHPSGELDQGWRHWRAAVEQISTWLNGFEGGDGDEVEDQPCCPTSDQPDQLL